MRRLGCLLALGVAGALVQAHTVVVSQAMGGTVTPTSTPVPVPTVAVPSGQGATVPTVTIPAKPVQPRKPDHRKRAAHHRKPARRSAQPQGSWILAFLTSYCPGSAGWISSSGMPVFYGMLANNYYQFGTRVYVPVIGMTGVVEDRIGAYVGWDHFDVWSPVCYSTPTGWYRVEVLG